METVRQTKLIINTKAVKHNIQELQKFVGPSVTIMPVIKNRGYGTGIGTRADLLKELNIQIVCVAIIDEGIALRQRGYKGEILVLNQPLKEEISSVLNYNLTISCCIKDFIISLNSISASNNKISKIHLEINTGMNRTGIDPKDIYLYLNLIKNLKYVQLDGIYSHLSSSDVDFEFTQEQINIFDKIVCISKKEFNLTYIHICNSAGTLNFKNAHYNSVRPGISIYGHLPDESLREKINLIPSTMLKSKISYIHNVKLGESISYNRSFIANKNMRIATIPIRVWRWNT